MLYNYGFNDNQAKFDSKTQGTVQCKPIYSYQTQTILEAWWHVRRRRLKKKKVNCQETQKHLCLILSVCQSPCINCSEFFHRRTGYVKWREESVIFPFWYTFPPGYWYSIVPSEEICCRIISITLSITKKVNLTTSWKSKSKYMQLLIRWLVFIEI